MTAISNYEQRNQKLYSSCLANGIMPTITNPTLKDRATFKLALRAADIKKKSLPHCGVNKFALLCKSFAL